jgi:hypothetical protein
VSIGASPPQQPPQLSPDGKWVWDGRQWQPVPVFLGDVAGVMPVKSMVAAAPAIAVAIPYSPPAIQAPAPIYVAPAAEEAITPLWEQPARSGVSLYLYVVAAAVVLVMVMIVLNSLNVIQLPWPGSGSTSDSRPAASPIPQLTVRSDYARADNYLNYYLAPALVALNQTLPNLSLTCNGTLSNSCLDSIKSTDKQLKHVLAVIDRGNFPPCIATGMSKLRIDFAGMDSGLTLALSAYQQNQKNLVAEGLNRFGSLGPAVAADAKSVDQAQKTCNTQPDGP